MTHTITQTALENQIAKLSQKETVYFGILNILGITGEDALSEVHNATNEKRI